MQNIPAKLLLLVITSVFSGLAILCLSISSLFLLENSPWSLRSVIEKVALGFMLLLSAFLICKRDKISRYITPLIFLYFSISFMFTDGADAIFISIFLALMSLSSWRLLNTNNLTKKYYAGNYSS